MVGWLQGAPYGKNVRESYQHGHQVFTIFQMIGDGEQIHDLFSEELIRTRWLDIWMNIRQPVFTESIFRILHNVRHRKGKAERHLCCTTEYESVQ